MINRVIGLFVKKEDSASSSASSKDSESEALLNSREVAVCDTGEGNYWTELSYKTDEFYNSNAQSSTSGTTLGAREVEEGFVELENDNQSLNALWEEYHENTRRLKSTSLVLSQIAAHYEQGDGLGVNLIKAAKYYVEATCSTTLGEPDELEEARAKLRAFVVKNRNNPAVLGQVAECIGEDKFLDLGKKLEKESEGITFLMALACERRATENHRVYLMLGECWLEGTGINIVAIPDYEPGKPIRNFSSERVDKALDYYFKAWGIVIESDEPRFNLFDDVDSSADRKEVLEAIRKLLQSKHIVKDHLIRILKTLDVYSLEEIFIGNSRRKGMGIQTAKSLLLKVRDEASVYDKLDSLFQGFITMHEKDLQSHADIGYFYYPTDRYNTRGLSLTRDRLKKAAYCFAARFRGHYDGLLERSLMSVILNPLFELEDMQEIFKGWNIDDLDEMLLLARKCFERTTPGSLKKVIYLYERWHTLYPDDESPCYPLAKLLIREGKEENLEKVLALLARSFYRAPGVEASLPCLLEGAMPVDEKESKNPLASALKVIASATKEFTANEQGDWYSKLACVLKPDCLKSVCVNLLSDASKESFWLVLDLLHAGYKKHPNCVPFISLHAQLVAKKRWGYSVIVYASFIKVASKTTIELIEWLSSRDINTISLEDCRRGIFVLELVRDALIQAEQKSSTEEEKEKFKRAWLFLAYAKQRLDLAHEAETNPALVAINFSLFFNDPQKKEWHRAVSPYTDVTDDIWAQQEYDLLNLARALLLINGGNHPNDAPPALKNLSRFYANVMEARDTWMCDWRGPEYEDRPRNLEGLEYLRQRVSAVVHFIVAHNTANPNDKRCALHVLNLLIDGGTKCVDRSVTKLEEAERYIAMGEPDEGGRPPYLMSVLTEEFILRCIQAKLVGQSYNENVETYLGYLLLLKEVLGLSVKTKKMEYARHARLGKETNKIFLALFEVLSAPDYIGFVASHPEFRRAHEKEVLELQKEKLDLIYDLDSEEISSKDIQLLLDFFEMESLEDLRTHAVGKDEEGNENSDKMETAWAGSVEHLSELLYEAKAREELLASGRITDLKTE